MALLAELSPHETMLASMEAVAEADVDIVPLFFQRYFESFPADRSMFYNQKSSHGLMVNEMLTLLLAQAEGQDWVPTFLRAQVTTHHDHGIFPVERYRAAFDILIDILRETAGERWTGEYETAWRGEAARMYGLIAQYY